jgi:hypothetical protein
VNVNGDDDEGDLEMLDLDKARMGMETCHGRRDNCRRHSHRWPFRCKLLATILTLTADNMPSGRLLAASLTYLFHDRSPSHGWPCTKAA